MKLLVAIFLFFTLHIQSQEIQGTVVDAKTKTPIFGASVYYDGSSVGTMTDEDGSFSIQLPYQNKATLVISHLGYVTQKIPNLPREAVLTIALEEEVESLEEVVLTSDPFTRKDKMEVFKLEFLGDTQGGRACEIVNEEDVHLYFNSEDNTLSAYSDKPIVVQNEYLGYLVHFTIEEFKIFFKTKNLKRVDNIYHTLFDGTTRFYDTSNGDSTIAGRRQRAYLGSPRHFIRACWYGDVENQNFRLKKGSKNVEISDFMEKSGDSSGDLREVQFYGGQFIIYHKKRSNYRSTLKINQMDTTYIMDRYGNYTPFESLVFGGHMSSYRIGDMLPMDYGF
ncbi:carboxypeptidase-like regulatory domain-containing protein [Muricauda sp. CAU 1633]|uniref:carboxypeptidase-like regulatory domain-containing protein n=1 Tax=Allomuricauda sp. CAU 1633 TaxID=2816036 RepID=UPI001A8D7749|nr:carboxypeptidase-like regulatory domain-containing protein [Muricauda sp. CAU 1633]MBO0323814.1 carboxypeptidase-like regulatory domain-containing protein [Muricauda sp. CAU 1633]